MNYRESLIIDNAEATDGLHPAEQLEFYINEGRIKGNDFTSSLINQYKSKGHLSDKQIACIHKMFAPKPAAQEEVIDVTAIVDLFRHAQDHLKFPKIRFTAGDNPVEFSLAGEKSSRPGTINVTDGGGFGAGKWYGRITIEGRWEKTRDVTPAVEAVVKRFAADPATVAGVYGVQFNNCCFCMKELTDNRSVQVGYGPVCAKNYGLPH